MRLPDDHRSQPPPHPIALRNGNPAMPRGRTPEGEHSLLQNPHLARRPQLNLRFLWTRERRLSASVAARLVPDQPQAFAAAPPAAEPSRSYQDVDGQIGCKSKYSEEKKQALFEKSYKGHTFAWTGEVERASGGSVALKTNPATFHIRHRHHHGGPRRPSIGKGSDGDNPVHHDGVRRLHRQLSRRQRRPRLHA